MKVTIGGEVFHGFRLWRWYVVSLFRPAHWYVVKPCKICHCLILPLAGCYCRMIEKPKEES